MEVLRPPHCIPPTTSPLTLIDVMPPLSWIIISLTIAMFIATILTGDFRAVLGSFKTPIYNTVAPAWINCEIGLLSAIANEPGRLISVCSHLRKSTGHLLWGLTSKHQVLLDTSHKVLTSFLCHHSHILTTTPMTIRMFNGPFGVKKYDRRLKEKLEPQLNASIASIRHNFMDRERVNALLEQVNIPNKVASLVNLSDVYNPRHWERCVRLQTLSRDNLPESVIVDDFFQLFRDFGTYLNILVLFGEQFYELHPSLVYDYWKWEDQAFKPLLCGVPEWFKFPFKRLREGIAARKRLQNALVSFSILLDGVVFKLGVQDVKCTVSFDTIDAGETFGYGLSQEKAFMHGHLFSASSKLCTTLAWFLIFIYSTPGLVDTLREEVAPYITLSANSPVRISAIDHNSLVHDCPRLKSALLETYRLVTETYITRYVKQSIRVEASSANNATQFIKAGSYVTVPLSMNNDNPRLFPDPETFDPERFLRSPELQAGLRTWGFGPHYCPARTYAQGLTASVAAAIITMWDVTPSGGEWPEFSSLRCINGVKRPAEGEQISVFVKPRVL
ncbi:Cytochrome P450 [Naviculisporaceae sp. PSN 640]